MNRSPVHRLAIGLAAVATVSLAARLFAGQQPSPVFTMEQAEAGRVAYAKHCASCHMPDLSGDNEKPPLVGVSFITTWGPRSTRDFLTYMAGAMPYGSAALDSKTYESLTAYILRSNGAVAGNQPLSASTDVPISSLTSGGEISPGGQRIRESREDPSRTPW